MILRSKRIQNNFLMVVDLISIQFAFYLASCVRFLFRDLEFNLRVYMPVFITIMLMQVFYVKVFDAYKHEFCEKSTLELIPIIENNAVLCMALATVAFMSHVTNQYSRLFFLYYFILNMIITYILRNGMKSVLYKHYQESNSSCKVLVVSTSDQIEAIIKSLKARKGWYIKITSIVIIDQDWKGEHIQGIPVVANRNNLLLTATRSVIDEVFISVPDPILKDMEEVINGMKDMGIIININICRFDLLGKVKRIGTIGDFTVISYSSKMLKLKKVTINRMIDILGAVIGLLFTGIIIIFLAPAIIIESPGPVFFKQTRIGKNGRRFQIYKFRSMRYDAETHKQELLLQNEVTGSMFKLTDDPRITRVGRFIRKTSLDELPQFFNVLKGDMSLVGTRPPTLDEYERYEAHHKRRLSLKPGITGLWQVSGRSNIKDFEEVVKLDLEYIDNWSFLLDLKILIRTIHVVLCRKGSK